MEESGGEPHALHTLARQRTRREVRYFRALRTRSQSSGPGVGNLAVSSVTTPTAAQEAPVRGFSHEIAGAAGMALWLRSTEPGMGT